MLLSIIKVILLFSIDDWLKSTAFNFFFFFLLLHSINFLLFLLFKLSNLFLFFLGIKFLSCLISVKVLVGNEKVATIFLSILSYKLEVSFIKVGGILRILELHCVILLEVLHWRYPLYFRVAVVNERILLVGAELRRRFLVFQHSFSYLSLGKSSC